MNNSTLGPGRATGRAGLAAVCVAAALGGAGSVNAATPLAGARPGGAEPAPLRATVSFSHHGYPVPRGFFGLAIEYDQLQPYERLGPPFAHFLSIVRPRDGGPLWLRLGGKSADHAIWRPPPSNSDPGTKPEPLPRAEGVFGIDATWLDTLSALVHGDDLRLVLDLNLAVHSPDLEAAFAEAARRALPPGALGGLDIGNEPNKYPNQPKLAPERVASTLRSTPRYWMTHYSPTDYRHDYIAYARAIKASLPEVPIGAPDLTAYLPQWLTAVTGLGTLNPSFLAIHRYAGSSCYPTNSLYHPSIGLLLSARGSAGLAASVQGAVAYAHSQNMRLRVTEINSISCGRDWGVANTFASALWAPAALLELIETGVAGVSWQIRPGNPAAPFIIRHDGIFPRPETYGLALFAQLTARRPTVLSGTVSGAHGPQLQAWAAVRRGGYEKVLVINDGSAAANVTVPAHAGDRAASVERLLAPGPTATWNVTFAGQQIGPDGLWHGQRMTDLVRARSGGYSVLIPGYSAALVIPG